MIRFQVVLHSIYSKKKLLAYIEYAYIHLCQLNKINVWYWNVDLSNTYHQSTWIEYICVFPQYIDLQISRLRFWNHHLNAILSVPLFFHIIAFFFISTSKIGIGKMESNNWTIRLTMSRCIYVSMWLYMFLLDPTYSEWWKEKKIPLFVSVFVITGFSFRFLWSER